MLQLYVTQSLLNGARCQCFLFGNHLGCFALWPIGLLGILDRSLCLGGVWDFALPQQRRGGTVAMVMVCFLGWAEDKMEGTRSKDWGQIQHTTVCCICRDVFSLWNWWTLLCWPVLLAANCRSRRDCGTAQPEGLRLFDIWRVLLQEERSVEWSVAEVGPVHV